MARVASVAKRGYFPAPAEAAGGSLRHLKVPDPPPDAWLKAKDLNIVDPCAGGARALEHIAEDLGVARGHALAFELKARRTSAEVSFLRVHVCPVYGRWEMCELSRRKAALPEAQFRLNDEGWHASGSERSCVSRSR